MEIANYVALAKFAVVSLHPTGRTINSDWFVHGFVMVVHEKKKLVIHWTRNSAELEINFSE